MRPVLALVVVLALASCSTARPAPARPSPAISCGWYSPTTATGDLVLIVATGPACRSGALIGWVAGQTRRPWTSTTLRRAAVDLADLRRGGSTVAIWQTPAPRGSAVTDAAAGYLADDLVLAGWLTPVP